MKKKTPAGTGAGATTHKPNNSAPGPVQKSQFKKRLSREPLTASELKLLNIVADGQNSKTGLFWQSNATLAENIGMTPRTVKRAMARLRAKGYVLLVKPGTRQGKANVYTLGSVTDDTTLSEVVTPVSISGDMGVQTVVTPASPLSMTLSEEYPRIERNRSAEGDAMPGGPAIAALGQRQPDKGTPGEDKYPDFWAAYPLKAGVRNAELKLGALINAGADYAAILAGARRYAEYCRSTKQVRRSTADAWLDRESWRDEWSAPKSKEQSKPKNQINTSAGIIPNDALINTKFHQQIKSWELKNKEKLKDLDRLEKLCKESERNLLDHAAKCDQCLNSGNFPTYDNELTEEVTDRTMLCETGQKLEKKYRPLIDGLVDLDEELQETRPREWDFPDD